MQEQATLLFVDDEVRIVNLLRLIFLSNYRVLTANSGMEALEIIRTQRVDVIVSDQRMPEMLGIDLLKEVLRISPGTMRILLTGYSDLAAIVGSVNDAEVFRFINKPWNQVEIKEIVQQAAQAALATREIMAGPVSELPLAFASSMMAGSLDLLVLDNDAEVRHAIADMFSGKCNVHAVSSVSETLAALEQHDIGVIVAEATVGSQDTGALLHTLKAHYPVITTVMLTKASDSDMVIDLINQAQIFRFATKPIRPSILQLSVSAAMREHQRLRADPRLIARI